MKKIKVFNRHDNWKIYKKLLLTGALILRDQKIISQFRQLFSISESDE